MKSKYYFLQLARLSLIFLLISCGEKDANIDAKEPEQEETKSACSDIDSLKILAEKENDANAQYNLGVCYDNGKGLAQDHTKAVEWYRKAAEQGYAKAQFNLGNSYDNGEGVVQDHTKAAEWYRKAAEQGYAKAQFNLGVCYGKGEGVEQDNTKAAEWYRKAAEQGHAVAQNNLGFCYDQGKGVAQDYLKAVECYRKAADQGHAMAQNNLKAKFLQIAKPFDCTPAISTLEEMQKIYKLVQNGASKWTDGPIYNIEPISQISFDGIKSVRLIFDKNNVLQAVSANFNKDKFSSLFESLDEKYFLEQKNIPHVGTKTAYFSSANALIDLEAAHLSFDLELVFSTREFKKLMHQKLENERIEKETKEKSML